MKFVAYNFGALLFLLMAGFMMYMKIPGYGWCIFIAACALVMPSASKSKDKDVEE